MEPRKNDADNDARLSPENTPMFDSNIIENWSQRFVLIDIERTTEIERLSQHVLEQERMIDELRKNIREILLDGLQIEEKKDEEQELFDVAVNMGRGNENLLKEIKDKTSVCKKTLKNFENFNNIAKNLNQAKISMVSEHRNKLQELQALIGIMKEQRNKYREKVDKIREKFVKNGEENSKRIKIAVNDAKTVLQKFIDLKQLSGLDLSGTISISQQLQKAVDLASKKNNKLKKITMTQLDKKKRYDEAIAEFSKEVEINSKAGESTQLEINQLWADEELLFKEKREVDENLVERVELLRKYKEEIEDKKEQVSRLDLAISGNEAFIEGMKSKMEQEKQEFEETERDLERKLSVVKEQVMAEKLEGLLMEGRLQEVENQVQNSKKFLDLKLNSLKTLEDEVQAHDEAYQKTVQKYNDDAQIIQKSIDQINSIISELKTQKLEKDKEIENERLLMKNTLNEIEQLKESVQSLKISNQCAENELECDVSDFKNLEVEIEALKKKREYLTMVVDKLVKHGEAFKETERLQVESEENWRRIREIEENGINKLKESEKKMEELKIMLKKVQTEKLNLDATCQYKQSEIENMNREVLKLKEHDRLTNEKLQKLGQRRKKLFKMEGDLKKKPRGRPPGKRSTTTADWEALIKQCVPIKKEKIEGEGTDISTVPKRTKRFFTSRQSRNAVTSTTDQKKKSGDVFDYETDDDVQFMGQVNKT